MFQVASMPVVQPSNLEMTFPREVSVVDFRLLYSTNGVIVGKKALRACLTRAFAACTSSAAARMSPLLSLANRSASSSVRFWASPRLERQSARHTTGIRIEFGFIIKRTYRQRPDQFGGFS